MIPAVVKRERRFKLAVIHPDGLARMFFIDIRAGDDIVKYKISCSREEVSKPIEVVGASFNPEWNSIVLVLYCEEWPVVDDGEIPRIASDLLVTEMRIETVESVTKGRTVSWRDLPPML